MAGLTVRWYHVAHMQAVRRCEMTHKFMKPIINPPPFWIMPPSHAWASLDTGWNDPFPFQCFGERRNTGVAWRFDYIIRSLREQSCISLKRMFGLLEWSLTKSNVEGPEIKRSAWYLSAQPNQEFRDHNSVFKRHIQVCLFFLPNKTSFTIIHIKGRNQETGVQ